MRTWRDHATDLCVAIAAYRLCGSVTRAACMRQWAPTLYRVCVKKFAGVQGDFTHSQKSWTNCNGSSRWSILPASTPPSAPRQQKCGQSKRRRWRPALHTRWTPPPGVCRSCASLQKLPIHLPFPRPLCARTRAHVCQSACVHVCVSARALYLAPCLITVSSSCALAPSLSRALHLSLHLSPTKCLQHLPAQSDAHSHLSPVILSLCSHPFLTPPLSLSSLSRALSRALLLVAAAGAAA